MAVKKSVRPKKKDRKNIEFGVAHISSTFNNTIVTLTDKNGNALSEAPERALRLQLRWQQRLLQRLLWSMA